MVYRVTEWQQLYMPSTAYAMSEIDFCQLPAKYDIDLKRLREELESVDAFNLVKPYPIPNTRGLKPGGYSKTMPGYYGICFKAEPDSEDPLYDGLASNSLKVGRRRDAKIDQNFTERTSIWFPYLTELENRFKGTVTQVRLIKLEAGYNLGENPHVDYPWYKGIRMHIPLTDGVKYEWHVLHNKYILDGSQPHLYYLDTGKPHTAINEKSTIDRWVFNINLIPHTTEIPIHQQIRQEIL